ncbi:hypothetical protein FJZ55_00095 [Candidatus Woesearchaeota archaeon]|nr:hypothetical protein [Candidatus Woesearchaeota archaeon]
MSHSDLGSYYQITFNLLQHHKYSLEELENMIPWERDIYINLLINHLKKEKERERNKKML